MNRKRNRSTYIRFAPFRTWNTGFIRLIHFSIVLIAITGLWIFVAFRVYSEYRKSIRKALESGSRDNAGSQVHVGKSGNEGRFMSELTFKENYFDLVSVITVS